MIPAEDVVIGTTAPRNIRYTSSTAENIPLHHVIHEFEQTLCVTDLLLQ